VRSLKKKGTSVSAHPPRPRWQAASADAGPSIWALVPCPQQCLSEQLAGRFSTA
jgi:hypothetical protein